MSYRVQKSKEVYEEIMKKEKRKQEAAVKKANSQGTGSICLNL
jgi:ribosomal protein S21